MIKITYCLNQEWHTITIAEKFRDSVESSLIDLGAFVRPQIHQTSLEERNAASEGINFLYSVRGL